MAHKQYVVDDQKLGVQMANKRFGTKVVISDGTNTQTIFKALDPWSDEVPGVWTTSGEVNQAARSTRLVPSVFAGIAARMQAMQDLPFTVYDLKGKEVDN